MRGEFIRFDGLVIPNNITTFGARKLLEFATRQSAGQFHMGLFRGFAAKAGQLETLNEPAFTNGYARQAVAQSILGWPVSGTLGVEAYVETLLVTFPAVGAYSGTVNRVGLVDSAAIRLGDYYCLSEPFTEILIDAATPIELRQFKYRLYFG
jgi:hypothetical protein